MKVDLNDRELALILGSIRYVQNHCHHYRSVFIHHLEFDDEGVTDTELDNLCEYLNCSG